ncbi:hypothetical protein AGMMS49959_16960 [Planctomycetales bacterium]|nr:hypothetical protein AGMMS49959_16960 [Planctomycetales bacterium]
MPYKISIAPKHLIHQQLQIRLFVVVNGDKNHAGVFEQAFGDDEAWIHKGKPRGVGTFAGEGADAGDFGVGQAQFFLQLLVGELEIVAVNKAVRAGVVGRVNVNDIHFAGVGVLKVFEGVEVVAGDKDILAVAIFGGGVMGGVGDEDGFGFQARLEFGVVLADEAELVTVADFVGVADGAGDTSDSGTNVGSDGGTETAADNF